MFARFKAAVVPEVLADVVEQFIPFQQDAYAFQALYSRIAHEGLRVPETELEILTLLRTYMEKQRLVLEPILLIPDRVVQSYEEKTAQDEFEVKYRYSNGWEISFVNGNSHCLSYPNPHGGPRHVVHSHGYTALSIVPRLATRNLIKILSSLRNMNNEPQAVFETIE